MGADLIPRQVYDTEKPILTTKGRKGIQAEQVQRLFAHGPRIYLFSIICALTLVTTFWSVVEHPRLLSWLAAIVLISALRWALSAAYSLAPSTALPTKDWHRLFIIGTVCAGITWGSAAIFLFPADSMVHQFFLIFLLTGLTTAAVPILAASPLAFPCFALPVMGPLIVRFLSGPDSISIAMGMLCALGVLVLLKAARVAGLGVQDAIALRQRNTVLERQLAAVEQSTNSQHQALHNALQTSEQKLADYTATASEWFWEMDAQLRFTYLSERFAKATGIPLKAILGYTREEFYQHYPIATPDALQDHSAVLARQQPFHDVELQLAGGQNETIVISISGKPVFAPNGDFLGYRGSGRNITDTHQIKQQLNLQRCRDTLTGLVNRSYLDSRLQQALDNAKTQRTEHALCFMDVDRFKIINDSHGHTAGDALLSQLARLLSNSIGENDVLARLGSDEFALLLVDCKQERAAEIVRSLYQKIKKFQCNWHDLDLSVSLSTGIAAINQHSENTQTILSDAENACLTAKSMGCNEIHLASASAIEKARRQTEISWLTQMDAALAKDQFRLYYQSIKPLELNSHGDGKAKEAYYEVLLRLDGENNKLISPGVFLPIAEKYGLAPQIDRWVINAVLRWLQQYLATNSEHDSRPVIGINLSGQSLSNLRLLDYIEERLDQYAIPARLICFEITETAAIANLDNATQLIKYLRGLGCQFALDDFGSGFSSYAYLKNLTVDYIKIDGSFISDIANNMLDKTMVQSIRDIGHAIGIKTIAEHVEDQITVDVLRDIGVDFIQGFHIDKPKPLSLQYITMPTKSERVRLRIVNEYPTP